MDYENFDNDAEGTTDANYFAFVEWLCLQTIEDIKAAGDNKQAQRKSLCRYYSRGYRANITKSELIDFLGVDTPSILDMTGLDETEGDALMELADSLTHKEIAEYEQS